MKKSWKVIRPEQAKSWTERIILTKDYPYGKKKVSQVVVPANVKL